MTEEKMEEEEQEMKNKNGGLSASTSASNGESISNDSWKIISMAKNESKVVVKTEREGPWPG